MPKFLSLLRGINVSGQKKIAMTDLKQLYESLGFKNVSTYIQSGNVIFENKDAKNLSKKIEAGIKTEFGFDVPVLTLTQEELNIIISQNPFLKQKNIDLERLYITYLAEIPSPEYVQKINAADFSPEKFIIKEKEIYLYIPTPATYGNTKLSNNFFENKLKVRATTRNWKTTLALSDMMK